MGGLTLRRRIVLLSLVVLMTGLGLFSWLGVQSVNDGVRRTLEERLIIARIAASELDATLSNVTSQLQGIASLGDSIMNNDKFVSAVSPVNNYLLNSKVFLEDIYLTDTQGKIVNLKSGNTLLIGYDMSGYSAVKEALDSKKPIVSGLLSSPVVGSPAVFIITPVFSTANATQTTVKLIGALISSIDLDKSVTGAFGQTLVVGQTGYTEIVDGNGIVIARTRPGSAPKIFEMSDHPGRFAELIAQGKATVGTCHRCHGTEGDVQRGKDILAFAPLSTASWGVAIRQSEDEALSPVHQLERRLLLFGIVLLASTALIVLAMMSSIVEPIRMLTSAAKKAANGDFTARVPTKRSDEIGQLSTAFQSMRQEIAKSRDELMVRYNEAKEKEELRGELLNTMISAQEEERKRVARELHDDYGQTLTGLIMSIESLEDQITPQQSQLKKKLNDTKLLISRTLDSIRKLTLDLHPSSLDDLGLVPALRSYMANYLQANGLNVNFESKGLNGRLQPAVETTLYRIVQEATHNIVKHARASNVSVKLIAQNSHISAIIEDDGQGFDMDITLKSKSRRSLGILGIQERTALLGGTFTINSTPGKGTRLEVNIPINTKINTN